MIDKVLAENLARNISIRSLKANIKGIQYALDTEDELEEMDRNELKIQLAIYEDILKQRSD